MAQSNRRFRRPIAEIHWGYPLILTLVAVIYPFGPSLWVHTNYHGNWHHIIEILFYAATGPLLGYWLLMRAGRWLDAREDAGQ